MLSSKPVTAARARNLTTILRPFVLWRVESIRVPYWTGEVRGWFRPNRDPVSRFGHIARPRTRRRIVGERGTPSIRYCVVGGRGRTAAPIPMKPRSVRHDLTFPPAVRNRLEGDKLSVESSLQCRRICPDRGVGL